MLLTPLIYLWLGSEKTLAYAVVICILIDFYFKGDRIVLSNFKTAAGVFEQDKYLALIQGVVNLIISIVLVQKVGLVGVYIGTIVSGLIANITKPIIIYKVILRKPVKGYFLDSGKYVLTIAAVYGFLSMLKNVIMPEVTIVTFAVMFVMICVVFNGVFLLLFGRTEELGYVWGIVKGKLKK